MRVLLVDDEPLAIRRISQLLEKFPHVEIAGAASNGSQALDLIRKLHPDLVFLDVEMPGQSGLEVAAALGHGARTEVVFVTAFDNYAADAFSVEATDYLLKPINPERLRQAIGRAERRQTERLAAYETQATIPETLERTFPLSNKCNIPERDIIWIEAAKDYALIHTGTRSHIVRARMSQLAQQLEPRFVRIHRSTLVSVQWVQDWTPPSKGIAGLRLRDGTEVQVGPSYLRGMRAILQSRVKTRAHNGSH